MLVEERGSRGCRTMPRQSWGSEVGNGDEGGEMGRSVTRELGGARHDKEGERRSSG